jgi:glycine oxidase
MAREWDAMVVGAGIIGCAVARELARRGARTAILDQRSAGGGATQASAGVLAPYIEAPGAGPLHDLTVRSLALYDDFIADIERDTGRAIEYRRCGTLEVATTAESVERLMAVSIWARAAGMDAQWMDGPAAGRLEPALAASHGALLVPAHGYVRAAQLTSSLLEAAARHGATFLSGRKVEGIRREEDAEITITAGGEVHRTAVVVIAAGSWSGCAPLGAPSVKPIRGQLLELRWGGPAITRVLWSESCYIVPWADGTVLVGATMEDVGFDERVTVDGVRDLLSAACRLMPTAGNATFVEARAGLRPSTADGLPIIGRSSEDPALIYATGHFRNGVLLAPLTAELVADLVVEGRSDPVLTLTGPGRN